MDSSRSAGQDSVPARSGSQRPFGYNIDRGSVEHDDAIEFIVEPIDLVDLTRQPSPRAIVTCWL